MLRAFHTDAEATLQPPRDRLVQGFISQRRFSRLAVETGIVRRRYIVKRFTLGAVWQVLKYFPGRHTQDPQLKLRPGLVGVMVKHFEFYLVLFFGVILFHIFTNILLVCGHCLSLRQTETFIRVKSRGHHGKCH